VRHLVSLLMALSPQDIYQDLKRACLLRLDRRISIRRMFPEDLQTMISLMIKYSRLVID
jgi:hypothetical protein